MAICPGWQVAYDQSQWKLQHWRVPRWRDCAFCRTRAGLELRIRELIGREHQAAVAHLPDWHPDIAGAPAPKWLDIGLRGSTIARGKAIREQVLAKQHLPNPITITLPDGTTTRVWLATSKDGKKIIGDELWWGVNCAGHTETPLKVVSSHETEPPHIIAPTTGQNGPRPSDDDYPLTFDGSGYPELPAFLDRRPKPALLEAA